MQLRKILWLIRVPTYQDEFANVGGRLFEFDRGFIRQCDFFITNDMLKIHHKSMHVYECG